MKGLLLKDFYMMLKYCKAHLLISLVFAAVSATGAGNVFSLFYPVFLASMIPSMIPVTLISYDERSGWNSYADTLPYTRGMLVSVKYIMALTALAVSLAIYMGGRLIGMLCTGGCNAQELLWLLGMLLSGGLIAPAVMLPVIFKFGVEKGRIAYYIVMVATVSVLYIVLSFLTPALQESPYPSFSSVGLWVLIVAAAAIFYISRRLSILFYQDREL